MRNRGCEFFSGKGEAQNHPDNDDQKENKVKNEYDGPKMLKSQIYEWL
jgi:hypothetical protein